MVNGSGSEGGGGSLKTRRCCSEVAEAVGGELEFNGQRHVWWVFSGMEFLEAVGRRDPLNLGIPSLLCPLNLANILVFWLKMVAKILQTSQTQNKIHTFANWLFGVCGCESVIAQL